MLPISRIRVDGGSGGSQGAGLHLGGKQQWPLLQRDAGPGEHHVKLVGQGEKIARIARITGLSRPTIYGVLRNQGTPSPPCPPSRMSARTC